MTLAAELVNALLEIDGVEEAPSQFNPVPALWIDGREFVNLHHGRVDVRLTRKAIATHRARLRAEPRVDLRSTDWIGVRLRARGDLGVAVELATRAAEANRGGPGATPSDRELKRRRATHRARAEDLQP